MDGRPRVNQHRPHTATFNGSHNASKTKALVVLYHRKHTLRLNTGLSSLQLHQQSGVSYDTLRSHLKRWVEYRYLARRPADSHRGRPVYYYTIAARGEHFIQDIVPRDVLDRYVKEIKQSREVPEG
jgi:predicted ArsR family transcriptional regulator